MGASAVLKLQKVGFTIDQVEALADVMDTQAASKADLLQETSALGGRLAQESQSIRAEFKAFKVEMKGDLEVLRHSLETRIEAARTDTLKTVMGMMIGTVSVNAAVVLGAMFGLVRLLGH
jgi:DNA-binding transcriptional MerR regulator